MTASPTYRPDNGTPQTVASPGPAPVPAVGARQLAPLTLRQLVGVDDDVPVALATRLDGVGAAASNEGAGRRRTARTDTARTAPRPDRSGRLSGNTIDRRAFVKGEQSPGSG